MTLGTAGISTKYPDKLNEVVLACLLEREREREREREKERASLPSVIHKNFHYVARRHFRWVILRTNPVVRCISLFIVHTSLCHRLFVRPNKIEEEEVEHEGKQCSSSSGSRIAGWTGKGKGQRESRAAMTDQKRSPFIVRHSVPLSLSVVPFFPSFLW